MARQIGPLILIFLCSTAAWVILGAVTDIRTDHQDAKLREAIGELWGKPQRQEAPQVYEIETNAREIMVRKNDRTTTETIVDTNKIVVPFESSAIDVKLDLDYRQKGLLWYSTYRIAFSGEYTIFNESGKTKDVFLRYDFPNEGGTYDAFQVKVDGDSLHDLVISGKRIVRQIILQPEQSRTISISYVSQGLGEWWYQFGKGVSQISNLSLTMATNFKEIDFPEKSMSPTFKEETDTGWNLKWDYDNLVSGIQIGLDIPQKLNPGPFVSEVSYFAPVSLFFFFFLLFIVSMMKDIRIHPMNYFFLAAAFFAFHLLLAYLADHINIDLAMLITSVVSIFLVVSYMRLVVGIKFALVHVGVAQFTYLVLFAYAFFFEGYTGLTITILAIITLFILMQMTGRINWYEKFGTDSSGRDRASAPPPPPPTVVKT